MPELNVLITAASTASAYKLEKLLAEADKVVFADSVDLPEILLRDKNFVRIPAGNSNAFSHQLLSICLDLGINQVFPLKRDEMLALAETRQLFDEYGITLMVPDIQRVKDAFGPAKSGDISINYDESAFAGRGVYISLPGEGNFQLLTAD